ncbi:MAG: hypothetical protein HY601_01485 [Candidatus Omnitrophica bacterium]|nr:hypothetical protein [Candidatus Omnitrophota bacterium]
MRRAALALWVWLACAPSAGACPGCKDALFDPSQAQQTIRRAQGYAVSIGVFLGVPLLLVGGVTAGVIRAARRTRQRPRAI